MILMSDAKRSILALYSQSLFSLEVFLAPVLVLFYLNYIKLTFYEMSTLFSLLLVLNWLFEVPTGVVSDAIGRKKALILGKIIYFVGMLLLVFVKDWYGLVFIVFLMALGNTLGSGNLSAICYELFCKQQPKEKYYKYVQISNSIMLFVSAVAAIVGGYLAEVDYRLVIYCDLLMLALATMSVWVILPKDNIATITKDKFKSNRLIYRMIDVAKQGGRFIVGSQLALHTIIIIAFSFALMRTGFNFYQPMIESEGIKLSTFGWLFALFNIIAAVSAYQSGSKAAGNCRQSKVIIITIVCMAASAFFILSDIGYFAVIVAIASHQVVRGILSPYLNYNLNRSIPNQHSSRSTILSFSALVTALTTAVVMTAAGFLEGYASKEIVFSIISITLLLVSLNYYSFLKRADKQIENEGLQLD